VHKKRRFELSVLVNGGEYNYNAWL